MSHEIHVASDDALGVEEYLPAGQTVHMLPSANPVSGENFPAAQFSQVCGLFMPVIVENFPATQGVHDIVAFLSAPGIFDHVPAGHGLQLAPDEAQPTVEYVPIGQLEH